MSAPAPSSPPSPLQILELVVALQQRFIREGLTAQGHDLLVRRLLAATGSQIAVVARVLDGPAGELDDGDSVTGLDVIAAAGFAVAPASGCFLQEDGPWMQVVRSLEPVIASWPESAPLTTGWSPPLRSLLGLPLLGDNGVTGALLLGNRDGGYDAAWCAALSPLASAVALLLEQQDAVERTTRMESELGRWSDLFAAAIEQTGVGVIATDRDGVIEFVNPSARRLLGISADEQRSQLELVSFHDPDELAAAALESAPFAGACATRFDVLVARARAGDGVDRREWTYVALTGARVPVMVALSALRDRSGPPFGWVFVVSEVAALRMAEAERLRAARLEGQLFALQRRELEVAKISEAYEYVSASRSLREALEVIAAFLPTIFGDPPPQLLVQRSSPRTDSANDAIVDGGLPMGLRAIETRDCWSLKTSERFVSEPRGLRCAHLGDDHQAWMCTPLHDGAGTVAVLSVPLSAPSTASSTPSSTPSSMSPPTITDAVTVSMPFAPPRQPASPAGHATAFDDASRRASGVIDLARQLSSVLANLRLRKTLEEQATHDPLTGAVNRRQLDIELKRTVQRNGRTGEPFAVLVVDVDHFKRINDVFGHERGDRVLAGLGSLLRRRLRSSDVLARVGGEEFVIVLRAVDRATSTGLAESFRAAVETAHLAGPEVTCTCSIGATHVARLDGDVEDLLRRADRALYAAKSAGRNRVVFDAEGTASAMVRTREWST